ncbi:MAG: hypothetical protein AUI47_00380 [Acidobacteria bacterium 13_1_40CM_2_68_5]|nr:MAG: hypothetical protein AUI47_00380 [Acidobacteria bacterium 13_1_40CM_2_68_5]
MKPAAGLLALVISSGAWSAIDAQVTLNLCGPGTNWVSLPSESPIVTAEDLCKIIGSAALSVAQFYPDTTAR